MTYIESISVFPIFLNVFFGNSKIIRTLFIGFFDDFIINIRKVLYKRYLISAVLQVAAQYLKYTNRPCISNVNIIVNSWSAGIYFEVAFLLRNQLFFLSG